MKRKTLKQNHPFMEKVNKLYEVMEELGITIEYGGNDSLNIVDNESQESYKLLDNDTSESLPYFPTGVEFKLSQYD